MRLGVAVLSAAVVVSGILVVTLASGDGGGGDRSATTRVHLGWDGEPRVVRVAALPRDRVLSGRLENQSLRPATLDTARAQVIDADGRALRSTVRFLASFAHGLYTPESINRSGPPGEAERRRLGELATLKPRESVAITVSWRLAPAGATPVRIAFVGSFVDLPRAP